jgi:hypothetical protein
MLAKKALNARTGPLGYSAMRRTTNCVARAFEILLRHHRAAKGDEAWVRGGARGELELARDAGDSWVIPPSARPHAYRMSAFGQVASDLGGL